MPPLAKPLSPFGVLGAALRRANALRANSSIQLPTTPVLPSDDQLPLPSPPKSRSRYSRANSTALLLELPAHTLKRARSSTDLADVVESFSLTLLRLRPSRRVLPGSASLVSSVARARQHGRLCIPRRPAALGVYVSIRVRAPPVRRQHRRRLPVNDIRCSRRWVATASLHRSVAISPSTFAHGRNNAPPVVELADGSTPTTSMNKPCAARRKAARAWFSRHPCPPTQKPGHPQRSSLTWTLTSAHRCRRNSKAPPVVEFADGWTLTTSTHKASCCS